MHGEFGLQKYKAEKINGEWVIQESVGDEIVVKNFINPSTSSYYNLNYNAVAAAMNTSQRVYISSFKFYTKGATLNSSSITTDTSSEDANKFIRGNQVSGKEIPEFTDGSIGIFTTQARFDPPATKARNIRTIINANGVSTYRAAASTVNLESPCVQQTNEVLLITHRYVYSADELSDQFTDFPVEFRRAMAHRVARGHTYLTPVSKVSHYNYSSGSYINDYKGRVEINSIGHTIADFIVDNNIDEGYAFYRLSLGTSDLAGKLLNNFRGRYNDTYGDLSNAANVLSPHDLAYTGYRYTPSIPFRREKDSAIQNSFIRTPVTPGVVASKLPFLDLDYIGASYGTATLSDNVLTGNTSYESIQHIAEVYRIEYTQGGNLSNAKYKFKKRFITGYDSPVQFLGQLSADINLLLKTNASQHYDTWEEQRISGNITSTYQWTNGNIKPLKYPELVSLAQYDSSPDLHGLFLYNLDDLENFPLRLDNTNLPGFTATDIRAVETADDGTLFVACADTGLWKLTRVVGSVVSDTTVTHISNSGAADLTSCYQVKYARPNGRLDGNYRLFALYQDELAYSDDNGDNWVILNSGTTPQFTSTITAWDNVIGMVAGLNSDNTTKLLFIESTNSPVSVDGSYGTVNADRHYWSIEGSAVTSDAVMSTTDISIFSYSGYDFNKFFYVRDRDYFVCEKLKYKFNFGLAADHTSVTHAGLLVGASIDDLVDDRTLTLFTTHSTGGILPYATFYADINDTFDLASSSVIATPEIVIRDGGSNSNHSYDMHGVIVAKGVMLTSGMNHGATDPYSRGFASNDTLSLISIGDNGIGAYAGDDFYYQDRFGFWSDYGWDGAEWVEGEVGDKLVHASSSPLIKGLETSFIEDASLPGDAGNFVLGEMTDIYVYDGIVKDDLTSLSVDWLRHYGLSFTGNDVHPNTVPANALGSIQIPFTVEASEPNSSTTYVDKLAKVVFDKNYISTSETASNNLSINTSVLMGPSISGDFTVTFRLSSISHNTSGNSTNYTNRFGLNEKNNVGSGGNNAVVHWGLAFQVDYTEEEVANIIIIDEGNISSTINITDYNPLTDTYEFVRAGAALVLRRNGTTIYTYTNTSTNTFKGVFEARALYTNMLCVWDATLSFTDTRLIVNVGNGTDTGYWDSSFASLSTIEYEEGIRKIYLDGVEAAIIANNGIDTPGPGEVVINKGSGEFVFNVADAGKVIETEWRALPTINKNP